MFNNEEMGSYRAGGGEFERDTDYITTRITAHGRDGYLAEPGRYRLIVARACPWADRTIIVRRLLGLEPVLSIGFCGPTHDERSWTFDLDQGGVDPVLDILRLQDAYFARFPDYPKGITAPAIVDVPTGQVVTNDFARDQQRRVHKQNICVCECPTELAGSTARYGIMLCHNPALQAAPDHQLPPVTCADHGFFRWKCLAC